MATAPQVSVRTIAPRSAGWDAPLNDNFSDMATLLNASSMIPRVYRVSASNPDVTKFGNLLSLDPTMYEGCEVWVMDPGGSGWSATIVDPVTGSGSVTHRDYVALSDGTTWVWRKLGVDVAGIA